jgi:predicted N-acyltransferase
MPQFLLLHRSGALAGAMPLFAKSHSYGEYVFDWAWAQAYEDRDLAYYPKWLAAVPFTPAPGSRLIARDEHARTELVRALVELAQRSGLSSLHVLLAPQAQAETLAAAGLMLQPGVQFHWRNAGYRNFDDFLGALSQEKRKKIRAERRKVAEAGLKLHRRVGLQISPEDWRFFYRCYATTYALHSSTPYLNMAFFLQLAQTMPENLMMVLATRGEERIAGAFGVFCPKTAGGTLYGRYWGAAEYVPCLHFECCYYQMIEFAIERGLAVFEGGAQGQHKMARGLDPVPTWSAHWIAHPQMRRAIGAALERQGREIGYAIDELAEHSAFRAARPGADQLATPGGRSGE